MQIQNKHTIQFGTDGWRAIIADQFTTYNVMRVSQATALWLQNNPTDNIKKVVIGYDCRFGGELFSQTAAKVLASYNIAVLLCPTPVTTPIVSYATKFLNADLGIIITASHNPPSYNGFKLKASYGGPLLVSDVQAIESLIPEEVSLNLEEMDSYINKGQIILHDLESDYLQYVSNAFDVKKIINDLPHAIVYDAMYGSGQFVARKIFGEKTHFLHCEYNPSFMGQAPEPLPRNLSELENYLSTCNEISIAVITDGDADRIAFYDNEKRFVDAHHILLLCIHYLHYYKKMQGKVAIAFSCSQKIKKLCEYYQLPCEVTPIGFKYICDIMTKENVLVGGEESGGIAVAGHIPERDGIWIALLLIEMIHATRKSLSELIQEIYNITGSFYYERWDLHISNEQKKSIIESCKNNSYTQFGQYNVIEVETTDGFKFHLGQDRWVMLRLSGTEPVLRIYAESESKAITQHILQTTKDQVLA